MLTKLRWFAVFFILKPQIAFSMLDIDNKEPENIPVKKLGDVSKNITQMVKADAEPLIFFLDENQKKNTVKVFDIDKKEETSLSINLKDIGLYEKLTFGTIKHIGIPLGTPYQLPVATENKVFLANIKKKNNGYELKLTRKIISHNSTIYSLQTVFTDEGSLIISSSTYPTTQICNDTGEPIKKVPGTLYLTNDKSYYCFLTDNFTDIFNRWRYRQKEQLIGKIRVKFEMYNKKYKVVEKDLITVLGENITLYFKKKNILSSSCNGLMVLWIDKDPDDKYVNNYKEFYIINRKDSDEFKKLTSPYDDLLSKIKPKKLLIFTLNERDYLLIMTDEQLILYDIDPDTTQILHSRPIEGGLPLGTNYIYQQMCIDQKTCTLYTIIKDKHEGKSSLYSIDLNALGNIASTNYTISSFKKDLAATKKAHNENFVRVALTMKTEKTSRLIQGQIAEENSEEIMAADWKFDEKHISFDAKNNIIKTIYFIAKIDLQDKKTQTDPLSEMGTSEAKNAELDKSSYSSSAVDVVLIINPEDSEPIGWNIKIKK